MKTAENTIIDDSLSTPSYIQLYNYFKEEIVSGRLGAHTRLPSLRALASDSGVSTTTTQLAYDQLVVEGYIYSMPRSGYRVSEMGQVPASQASHPCEPERLESYIMESPPYIADSSVFDFSRWRKCANKVFCDFSEMLLFESDPQGEGALRHEIAGYLRLSRGVIADASNIVIGAGTQQLTGQLAWILKRLGIRHVSLESPGYLPVQRIFSDGGFAISQIPVARDGLPAELLPRNISSAVYVSPSNHFPTGAVMPIGGRNRLLQWAEENDSLIIEDDYDSELRYFGKPIPAMQGLDKNHRVIYLGSFSSTLFPAAKISYMVLPPPLMPVFQRLKGQYSQTCSKAEQLTLALFIEGGYYSKGIRRLRSLNAQKLQQTLASVKKHGVGKITAENTNSGLNIILSVRSPLPEDVLCERGAGVGLLLKPLSSVSSCACPLPQSSMSAAPETQWLDAGLTGRSGLTEPAPAQRPSARHPSEETLTKLIFYYNKPPLAKIDGLIERLTAAL